MNRRSFLTQAVGGAVASTALMAMQRSALAGSDTPSRIRVGVIGTAHSHAAGKVAAMRDLTEDFEIVGVVERDPKLRGAAESLPEYAGLSWMDEKELYAQDGLRAVLVETEFVDLIPTAANAVNRGLSVHVDKPPGRSVRELADLFAAADSRRVQVQIGYMLRYNPAFEFCFRAVREGWLGRVFELNTTMSTVRPTERRATHYEPLGGAMFDLGSHVIDAVVTVLGVPTKVHAFGHRLYPKQDDVVDNQLAVFEYPEALATVRATFVEPFAGDRRQFVVCGEKGTIEIRPLEEPKLKLTLADPVGGFNAGHNEIELAKMQGRYHDQLRDFAAMVRDDSVSRWSADHDLAVQKALLLASGIGR